MQVDWDRGSIGITSITAYRELKNLVDQDVDFTSADIVRERRDQRVKTFTQEFRVTSDFDGPLNFLLGGFYFNEDVNQDSGLTTGTDSRTYFTLLARAATGNPAFSFASLEEGSPTSLGIPAGGIFAAGPLTSEDYSMSNEAWSVFGTLDFEPIEGLVFTGGLNYTKDKKDFALSGEAFEPLSNINLADAYIIGAAGSAANFAALPAAVQAGIAGNAVTPCPAGVSDPTVCNPLLGLAAFQFQPPFLEVPNPVEDGKTRDDKLTYLARVAYEVSPNINVYASYATGFKASSVNLSRDSRPLLGDYVPASLPDGVKPVVGGSNFLSPSSPIRNAGLPITNLTTGSRFAGPENAEVYELGLKANWPGLNFNLALFDQTIKGFQSFTFTGTGFTLANAGQQSVKGFEFSSTVTPVPSLVYTFAATYLDPVYDSFVNSPVGDLTGERPAGIPEWSLATSLTHILDLGSGNQLLTRVDYSHESNTKINNGLPTFGPNDFMREVNLVNASATVSLDMGLEFGVWARNLLNDQYILTVFDGVAQAGTVSGYPSAPRTYGAMARFKF